MVEFLPFRGLRYNPAQLADLAQVVAPPYDVITEDERRRLEGLHPWNIVRLILSQPQPGDTETDNQYTRSAALFREWQAKAVLIREAQPAFYVYRQTFAWEGRTHARIGVLGALQLADPARGPVRLHEATLSGPKADRVKLVQAVRANLSPILCLYTNAASPRLTQLVRQAADTHPPTTSLKAFGQTHDFWVVAEPETVRAVQEAARDQELLVADGHHRYEVGWECRQLSPSILAYLAAGEDPGIVIGPIHRLVPRWPDSLQRQLEQALGDLCALEPVNAGRSLEQAVKEDPQPEGVFGLVTRSRQWLVRLQLPRAANRLGAELPEPWRALDVPLLEAVLTGRLGVPAGALQYAHDAGQAHEAVAGGRCQAAWLLRPTRLEQILRTVEAGYKMPPKSTFFYPKLLTGLVMNPFTP